MVFTTVDWIDKNCFNLIYGIGSVVVHMVQTVTGLYILYKILNILPGDNKTRVHT